MVREYGTHTKGARRVAAHAHAGDALHALHAGLPGTDWRLDDGNERHMPQHSGGCRCSCVSTLLIGNGGMGSEHANPIAYKWECQVLNSYPTFSIARAHYDALVDAMAARGE